MSDWIRTAYQEFVVMMQEGGFVMPFLLVSGVLLWFGIAYRAVVLQRGTGDAVRDLVRRGWAGEIEHTHGFIDTAARIATSVPFLGSRQTKRILDDELFTVESDLGRYRTLVRTIVVIAPLAGLLGTVAGMIEMFRSLGSQTFYSQSGGVANGISQALLTTQFGLLVAIPGMIVGRLLDRKQDQMAQEVEQIKELVISSDSRQDEQGA